MNDTNDFNSDCAECLAGIITMTQQGDYTNMGQSIRVFLGVENPNSPVFSCYSYDNLVY